MRHTVYCQQNGSPSSSLPATRTPLEHALFGRIRLRVLSANVQSQYTFVCWHYAVRYSRLASMLSIPHATREYGSPSTTLIQSTYGRCNASNTSEGSDRDCVRISPGQWQVDPAPVMSKLDGKISQQRYCSDESFSFPRNQYVYMGKYLFSTTCISGSRLGYGSHMIRHAISSWHSDQSPYTTCCVRLSAKHMEES